MLAVHPVDRFFCERSHCEEIDDYVEVNEQGDENFACAAPTSSERWVCVLPKGVSGAETHRGRSASAPRVDAPSRSAHHVGGALEPGPFDGIGEQGVSFVEQLRSLLRGGGRNGS